MRSAVDKRVISPPGITLRNNGRYLECAWCEELLSKRRIKYCSRKCLHDAQRKVHAAEAAVLYRAGWTARQITTKYGCGRSTLYLWLKKMAVKFRTRTRKVNCFCGRPRHRVRSSSLCYEHLREYKRSDRKHMTRSRRRNLNKWRRRWLASRTPEQRAAINKRRQDWRARRRSAIAAAA